MNRFEKIEDISDNDTKGADKEIDEIKVAESNFGADLDKSTTHTNKCGLFDCFHHDYSEEELQSLYDDFSKDTNNDEQEREGIHQDNEADSSAQQKARTFIGGAKHDTEHIGLDNEFIGWQKVHENNAAKLSEELKQINENPNLSEAERAVLIKKNFEKRELFSENYEKEYTELQSARNEMTGKASADVSDDLKCAKEISATDVPKLDDIHQWINDINPNYDPFDWKSPYSNNCGSCAFAVEQRLNGNNSIVATDENIGTIEEMSKTTGMEQVSMSPDKIKDYLISQGAGSHGIVGIDRDQGPGHWFNAYYDGEKVVAIDGQTGEINDWPPDYGDVTNWDISVRKEKEQNG